MRVLDAVEQHDQPSLPAACVRNFQNVFERSRRARRGQRDHALVVSRIGQPVKLPAVFKPYRHALLARQLHDFFDARILPPLRNGNPIDRPLRLQRFLHGMNPCQAVHGRNSLQASARSGKQGRSRTGIPACPRCVSANPAPHKTPLFSSAPISPLPQTKVPPPHPATESPGPTRLPPPAPQALAGSDETIPARADPAPLSTV